MVRIERRKWPDAPHYGMTGTVLGHDDHGVWVGTPPGSTIVMPDGTERRGDRSAIWYVPYDDWFLLHYWHDHPEVLLYVDICTPSVWTERGARTIDLDFDVVVWSSAGRRGSVELVDADEFEEHRVTLGYPDELVSEARRAADDILERVRAARPPFDVGHVRPWLEHLSPACHHGGAGTDQGVMSATSPPGPRFVDATRPPGRFRRFYAAITATRPLLFFSRHVMWKLDPILLRLTRGRVAGPLIFPTAVLETRGARTGERRRNAVIYWNDGDRITIAASQAGSPRNPSWYHNLLAHPEVTFGGAPMTATVVDDCERERLWSLGDRVFPAFATYRRRAASAGRAIPLIQLSPRANGTTHR